MLTESHSVNPKFGQSGSYDEEVVSYEEVVRYNIVVSYDGFLTDNIVVGKLRWSHNVQYCCKLWLSYKIWWSWKVW